MGMTMNRERGKAKLREGSQRDNQVRRGGLSEEGKQGVWPEVCTYVNTGGVQHTLFGKFCHFLSFTQIVYEKQEEKGKGFRLRGDSKRQV